MSTKLPPLGGIPKRLIHDYEAGIAKITKRVLPPKLADKTPEQWLAEIAARSQQADIHEASNWLARKMVQAVSAVNMKTWRQAAAKHMRSAKLYKLLRQELQGATGRRVRQLVKDNAEYIRSLPLVQATKLTQEIAKATQQGARPATIAKMMRTRFPELLRSRVRLIARTESQKASSALTQARAEDLSIPCYVWRTSKDARVRHSHDIMEDVIVFWDDPPSPEALAGIHSTLGHYNAGDSPNDRCYPEPLLTLGDVNWPHKVYSHGATHMMTLQAFKKQFAKYKIEEEVTA